MSFYIILYVYEASTIWQTPPSVLGWDTVLADLHLATMHQCKLRVLANVYHV